MLGRRGFLKGIVAAAAGNKLIIEASAEDVQAFGAPRLGKDATALQLPNEESKPTLVYDAQGRALGMVVTGDVHQHVYKAPTLDGSMTLMRGLSEVRFECVSLNTDQIIAVSQLLSRIPVKDEEL